MIPETDSVSWVITVISAMDFWVRDVISLRLCPTHWARKKYRGTVATATRVSCHDRYTIAPRVLARMAMLAMVSLRVVVTTCWMPPTSFDTRDWISPVRVLVKNRSDMPCRCAYTESRRSRITYCPTLLVTYVWKTPMAALAAAIPTITPPMIHSSLMLGPLSDAIPNPSSNTTWMSIGFTTPTTEVTRIRNTTTDTWMR